MVGFYRDKKLRQSCRCPQILSHRMLYIQHSIEMQTGKFNHITGLFYPDRLHFDCYFRLAMLILIIARDASVPKSGDLLVDGCISIPFALLESS